MDHSTHAHSECGTSEPASEPVRCGRDHALPHSKAAMLARIADRYGTPTYAFDICRLRAQVQKLRRFLPAEVEIFYSLKANASLGICDVFSQCGIGADVASVGELVTAVAAGFEPDCIFVAGPWKSREALERLQDLPEAIVSVDSLSELRMLISHGIQNPVVLRLRPDFTSAAVVAAGHECRFGFLKSDVAKCRELVRDVDIVGFHVFAGSQVLQAEGIVEHLRNSCELARRSADMLNMRPMLFNLGGGFGIPYRRNDQELDLEPIGAELARLIELARPARIALELGRYLVAESGWYLTSVVGHQTYLDRPAVIVDGGTHQRADMCGLCLRTKADPPLVIAASANSPSRTPTHVLGCLSLPADVLCESAELPPLESGDLLAFANAGAYGLWSSPAMFHGHPLPAEVAFDENELYPMRERRPAASIIHDQQHIPNVR